MDNIHQEVKGKIDLVAFIAKRTGKHFRKEGNSQTLEECPFCQHKDCFRVDEEKQLFKCFSGTCEKGGDVFTFLEELGLSKADALHEAAVEAGVELTKASPKKKPGINARLLEAAVQHYTAALWTGGRASYLTTERGRLQTTLETMRVGYSTGTLAAHLERSGFKPEDIIKSGLAKGNGQGKLKDFFPKGLYIYPHTRNDEILHITQKDPKKKYKFQLPAVHRSDDWSFYNQSALSKYKEIILCEGEDDVQALIDVGMRNAVACIGQISHEQIKQLRNHLKGKHLYLCFDNDAGGRKYVRKIVQELAEDDYHIKIMVLDPKRSEDGGVKDVDEFLRKCVKDRRQTEAKRVFRAAIFPLAWELEQVKELAALEEKLLELREHRVFERVADLVEVEKEVFIEKLLEIGFTRSAIEQQLLSSDSILERVNSYMGGLHSKKDADPNQLAGIIFKAFAEKGRWFYDRQDNCFLFYKHKIYMVGSNRPFNALIKKYTTLLPTKEPGRSMWEALASDVYNKGQLIQMAGWLHTDRAKDAIYVNLNSDKNTILKLTEKKIEEIPNGTNADEVLLTPSKRIMPFNFQPDAKIKEGMDALNELIFENMTCEREQRYLILTWLMSAFLIDYNPYSALMKFSGSSASGKTTAAKFINLLLYADPHLTDPTASAAYTVAAGNPLITIDNLESEDVTKSILKFLLLSATKGSKEKRAGGTDTETIEESPKALVLITAIEPFAKSELINRTYDIEFSKKHMTDDFFEDEVVGEIIKKRDLILSALLKIVANYILPNLSKRRDYTIWLKKEHRGHAKERTNEFLATLCLTLDAVLKYIPYYDEDESELLELHEDGSKEIRSAWIKYQDDKAKDTEVGTNPMVTSLNMLLREYMNSLKDDKESEYLDKEEKGFRLKLEEYGLEFIVAADRSEAYFLASSGALYQVFAKLCRNLGMRHPYKNPQQLGVRLKNDESSLKDGGWRLEKKPGQNHFVWIHGERVYKFKKTLKEVKKVDL
ncbi:MAG: toprim domain-containing protein [Thermodesulfobacteriota bacterium]